MNGTNLGGLPGERDLQLPAQEPEEVGASSRRRWDVEELFRDNGKIRGSQVPYVNPPSGPAVARGNRRFK